MPTITREHKVAWLATFTAVLIAFLALHSGMGLGNILGAALITYVAIVVGISFKLPLEMGRVVMATGRGAIIAAVVTVLVLIGIYRAFKGL